ncbi:MULTISPECIES: hypothetical protein [Bradyrhizobium]|uniref:hypothetical protein n=1 Tax=Bradyrhizobium TaxID=374 RepID=UPI001008C343|nr:MULTISPECIES: hypothetical protein [Bradyrhizobium]MDA9400901.1 hypothetical protein [Bradyrhizobium sp. CCBAU 45389]MDA9527292.1 hypothetical protein [Bradyrhizobium sp. CCBAU 25338]RXH33321.1 hypothetical protein XH84_10135 [Bradyrhizobium nanningense]
MPQAISENSTRLPGADARPEPSRNHYGNLEEQICDLVRAADIAATLVEIALKQAHPESLPAGVEERLIFAAYEVEKRAKALRDFAYDPKTGVLGYGARAVAEGVREGGADLVA